MRSSVLRKHTCLSLSLLLLVAPLARAQTEPCVLPNPLFDNRDGYFVNFEEAPVHPIELIDQITGGSELWAVNIPDASVVVYNASNPASLVQAAVIKVGLGPVTIRQRPDSNEVWVVCQSSNSIFIIDRVTRRVVDSIRVTYEPAGLVFDAAGERAWVTLSASNQVAEIDADDREVDVLREFATQQPALSTLGPAHAEEPRALILANNDQDLFVLSNESGNGTTGLKGLPTGVLTDTILDLWPAFGPAGPLPPDRDVIHFDLPGNPPAAIDHGDIALWRMGSMNFDLKMDSQGEIWVSNMDFNNLLLGEHQFPSGKIAKHRVSHAAPLPATPPPSGSPPPAIDLNANLPAALIGRTFCALPNEMAFSADGKTLYVACYETHNVVVVDLDPSHVPTHRVIAELKGLTLPTAAGERLNAGVRGIVLREPAGVLYAYSRDNRIQVYPVPVAPGTVAAPVQTLPIGFDITSVAVKRGRFQHINARRSASGVQSCNTCHVDGHMDRIAWDLSDFTGDLPNNPMPRVPKGTKVTMSLRGIEETPPFHWRGDRTDLSAFNPAFKGLLGGTELSPAEMKDFEAFIFSLSYPSNPKQPEARAYSPEAMAGLANFHCKPAHAVALDKATAREFACSTCHSLAGFSGTNNQINNDLDGQFADDATQLRGLFDKESDVYDYSGFNPSLGHLAQIPATGWGFGNTGFSDDPKDFVNDVGVFDLLSEPERNSTVDFMKELDTGTAPAAAYAWTLHQLSALVPVPGHPFSSLLQDQAEDGHIDLVVRGWMTVGGTPRAIGMLYDAGSDTFATSISGVGPFPYSDGDPATADLVSLAAAGQGVFTLLGTPVGMGYRLALDEEMDFLKDGDETAHGAVLGAVDSDGDKFSDGYEVRLGSHPGNPSSLPPPETVAPQILDERVAWKNSNLAKVRWTTDEESISRIAVHPAGSSTVLFTQEEKRFKKQHVLVVRGLTPGKSYDFHIVSEDPASPGGTGNTSTDVLPNVALQPPLVRTIHLSETKLAFGSPTVPGGPVPVTATFRVVDQGGQPIQGAVVEFVQLEWKPNQGNQRKEHRTFPSAASGDASFTFPSFHGAGSGAKIEVFATAVTDAGNLFYFHPLDGQFGFWKQENLP